MNEYLTDEMQSIFKLLLTGDDYKTAAKNSSMSFSTVNNIVNKKTKVTASNYMAYKELVKLSLKNIDGFEKFKPILQKELA